MKYSILFLFLFINIFQAQELNICNLVKNGNILICDEIKINDKSINGKFIFDTGAAVTLLDSSFIPNNSNIEKQKTNTYYGTLSFENIILKSFKIGLLEEKDIKIGFVDLKNIIGNCNENKIIGILGRDIIEKNSWKIDFKNKKVSYSQTNYATDGFEKFQIFRKYIGNKLFGTKNSKSPVVKLEVDSVENDFIFDTGSFEGVVISTKHTKNNQQNLLEMQNAYGNIVSEEFFRNKKIRISNQEIIFPVRYSDHIKTSIGFDFMKNFDLILDKGLKNIYLKKNESFSVGLDIQVNFGFSLDKYNNSVRIAQIYKNSPAYNSGLKVLDEIAFINNINLEQYDLCTDMQNVAAQFEKSQMTIRLKNGKIINIIK